MNYYYKLSTINPVESMKSLSFLKINLARKGIPRFTFLTNYYKEFIVARKKKELIIEVKPGEIWDSTKKTLFRKTRHWLEFRLEVIKERKVCECCGSGNGGLTLHHHYLTNKAEDYTKLEKDRFHVLCSGCHRYIHRVARTIYRKKNPPNPLIQLKEIVDKFIEEN